MIKKKAIVTLADSNYFDLLIELIDSIKRFPKSSGVAICILDSGLTDKQIKILRKKKYLIKKAEWDINVPYYKRAGKEWLKSQVSRAFLPKYFPGFDSYLWIDCDAWVCNWDCLDLYFKGCKKGKLAISQTIGQGYRSLARVKWLFGSFASVKTQNYKHAKKSGIDENSSRKIAFAPHLNIGVFALEANSKCWKIWQQNLRKTLSKGQIFGSEGLAINLSVYVDKVDTEFLPLNCNWIASNLLPKYDSKKKIFVEPNLPNYPIGIMHLAAGIWKKNKDMRTDKKVKIDIETLNGKKIKTSLRF